MSERNDVERAYSKALGILAESLDKDLEELHGGPMGFALVVYAPGRMDSPTYVGSGDYTQGMQAMEAALTNMKDGAGNFYPADGKEQ